MASAATLTSISVPSPGRGRGPASAPSPDPEVPFLDRARATHFAEILKGLRESRASRDATVESLRAKHAAGDALTVGERAVLEVDRRCVAQTSRRAALRALETLDARLASWDARGFGADPRFGDAALESSRARLATAKEDATQTVAAAHPAIAEARCRARSRSRAALELRLEASRRRQREDRYEFDADLAAARDAPPAKPTVGSTPAGPRCSSASLLGVADVSEDLATDARRTRPPRTPRARRRMPSRRATRTRLRRRTHRGRTSRAPTKRTTWTTKRRRVKGRKGRGTRERRATLRKRSIERDARTRRIERTARRGPFPGSRAARGRSAVGSVVSRTLADDPDSSASDASRAMGAAARDAPSGALDESDSFDV